MKRLIIFGVLIALPLLFAGDAIAQLNEICDVPGAQNNPGDSGFCDAPSNPGAPTNNRVLDILETITNVLLLIVGVIAVITIIIGGIQYVTSAGDPSRANRGRSTIIYSIVAIITAILARSIIVFVLDRI